MKKWPSLKTLLISGYADESTSDLGGLDEGVDFLQKPFTPQVLAEKLRGILDNDRANKA